MAAITVTFDSVTKEGVVAIDGTAVADLNEFHLYGIGRGQFCVELYSRTRDQASGMEKMTRVCAAQDGTLTLSDVPPDDEKVLADIVKRYGVAK